MQARKALITGASARLGKAMALALAKDGFDVAIHYHGSPDLAEETAGQARDMGVKAVTCSADLLNHSETDGLLPAAIKALDGPISVLINNASIFEYDTVETASLSGWDRHINSNLRAPFFLTQALAKQAPPPILDEAGEPVAQAMVLNMIDMRVRKLTPEFSTYTIAKAGLWAFTQTAAQGLAPRVRVNAIGPGPTLQGARQSAQHFAAQRENTVLERGANPADIVAAMHYFLNAPAVTGQLLCVDGGQHLGWKTPDVLGVE